jgi:hypothetical protein
MAPVRPGDEVTAEIAGLGRVTARFGPATHQAAADQTTTDQTGADA